MKWKEWLENWSMTSLKIKTPFLESEFKPKDEDKDAAWELYIELLTRITTQQLPIKEGVEAIALDSVHNLFELTRDVIKRHGRQCNEFTKLAVIVLNQKIRPFTTRWHRISQEKGFETKELSQKFRYELESLQGILLSYTKMLADMADVEDLTELEE